MLHIGKRSIDADMSQNYLTARIKSSRRLIYATVIVEVSAKYFYATYRFIKYTRELEFLVKLQLRKRHDYMRLMYIIVCLDP